MSNNPRHHSPTRDRMLACRTYPARQVLQRLWQCEIETFDLYVARTERKGVPPDGLIGDALNTLVARMDHLNRELDGCGYVWARDAIAKAEGGAL